MMFKDYRSEHSRDIASDLRALAASIDTRSAAVTRLEVNTVSQAETMTKVRLIIELDYGFPSRSPQAG